MNAPATAETRRTRRNQRTGNLCVFGASAVKSAPGQFAQQIKIPSGTVPKSFSRLPIGNRRSRNQTEATAETRRTRRNQRTGNLCVFGASAVKSAPGEEEKHSTSRKDPSPLVPLPLGRG